MKTLALALFALISLPLSAQAQLRQGEVEAFAEIVKVEDNQMFPVRTVALTAMIPCGARVLGAYANRVGEEQVEVGVKMAVHQSGMFCLAMPRPVQLQVSFHSETPARILVRNFTRGQVLE